MTSQSIYVFGSNLSGRHGKGAALHARTHFGAVDGKGVGLQGSSYAIPTKDHALRAIPLDQIAHYVNQFIEFATEHPELTLQVSRVGCGLAGYSTNKWRRCSRGCRRIADSQMSGGCSFDYR